jgi:hypothetical protein
LHLFVYPCLSLYVYSTHVSVFLFRFLFFSSPSLSLYPSFILFTQQHCSFTALPAQLPDYGLDKNVCRIQFQARKNLSFLRPALTN